MNMTEFAIYTLDDDFSANNLYKRIVEHSKEYDDNATEALAGGDA